LKREREEQPTVAIITRSAVKTNMDVANLESMLVLEVRMSRGPNPPFNPQKEKETLIEAR